MPEILLDPKTWASFLTLTALEIVLGIDNLLFITIVSGIVHAAQSPLRSVRVNKSNVPGICDISVTI